MGTSRFLEVPASSSRPRSSVTNDVKVVTNDAIRRNKITPHTGGTRPPRHVV